MHLSPSGRLEETVKRQGTHSEASRIRTLVYFEHWDTLGFERAGIDIDLFQQFQPRVKTAWVKSQSFTHEQQMMMLKVYQVHTMLTQMNWESSSSPGRDAAIA